jgi:hypothetical protein
MPDMATSPLDRRLDLAALTLGVLAGWAALWWLGRAFVLTGDMGGYGWPGYVLNGWLAHLGWFTRIDTLRTPLHPILLSFIGDHLGSYADAGILLSSLSCGLAVLCAGLGAAALSGGGAGGLAALATGLALGVHGAPSAVNQYPFLAGLFVSAAGLSAVAARWPGVLTGALAGAALSLSMAAESRGLLLAPAVLAMVGIGAWRASGWGRVRLVVGFVALLSAGLWMRAAQSDAQHARMIGDARGLGRQAVLMDQQREVIDRWVRQDRELREACEGVDRADFLTLPYLSTDCARAMLTENLTVRLPRHLPLSGALTVAGVLLLLLPVRGRRGGSLEGAAGLLAAGSVLAVAAITPMPARYAIQQAPLLALLGAAGLGRLAGWLPGKAPLLAMLGLTGWMLAGGWDGRSRPDRTVLDAIYTTYVEVHHVIETTVTGDDVLIDCADLHQELALLPRRTRSATLTRDVSLQECLDWIELPERHEGVAYILVRPGYRLRGQQDLSAVLAEDGRWEQAASGDDWALWRRQ